MFNTLSRITIGALLLAVGAAEAQAQYRSNGRYTTRRPVYVYDDYGGDGRTTSIVTQTPQGPVRSTKTVDPRTGEEISTTYWRDPRTGQVTTSRACRGPADRTGPREHAHD